MHRRKSYYHGFFKYGAISKSHPCEADVCRCQNLSNFMTSTENVNKLCLFVQETEHLQVKLTMMVCPERISNVYNFTDVGFILIQHSGSMSEQEECWYPAGYPVVVLNLANRVYLHQPSVLTSIGSLDLYEDYVLKDSISTESTGQI